MYNQQLEKLIEIFTNHFATKSEYIKIIRKYKHQRENWFLVEIIKSLTEKKIEIRDQISYNGIKGKLDISIEYENIQYLIELKHYVDEDIAGSYPLRTYLKPGNKQYYANDLRKLSEIAQLNNSKVKPIFLIFLTGKIDDLDINEVKAFIYRHNNINLNFNHKEVSNDLTVIWFNLTVGH